MTKFYVTTKVHMNKYYSFEIVAPDDDAAWDTAFELTEEAIREKLAVTLSRGTLETLEEEDDD